MPHGDHVDYLSTATSTRSTLDTATTTVGGVKSASAHTHPRRAAVANPSDATIRRAAALLRAAGEPSRLRILHRLSLGEWCVTELAEETGAQLSTLSQQLRLLHGERLVSRRRERKHVYYELADKHVEQLLTMVLNHVAEDG